MKYKVGDKVRVRSDLEIGKAYKMEDEAIARWCFTTDMRKFCGEVVTIKKVDEERNRYFLKEDKREWLWTDEMFAGLADGTKFHVYDTVKHEKYGLGTVIKIGSNIDVDFDEKPFDRPSLKNNVLHCRPENLIVVQAYTGGEDR